MKDHDLSPAILIIARPVYSSWGGRSFFIFIGGKMKKSMSQVDFEVDEEGTIFLTQESMCNENGYDSISFTKEQAPIIIKWIQDAINE
jgi:hypothetical protein